MTRPVQKQAERRTLDRVIAALGMQPDNEPQQGETPDFLLCVGGRPIGVEVTIYRSGATVEDGTERRPVESEWEHLKRAANTFWTQQADLRDVNTGLTFKGRVPPRREHSKFLDEIAAFVRGHAGELSSKARAYWPASFQSPLMQTYLGRLCLRTHRYAEWYSNLAAGSVAAPGFTIAEIVEEKSAGKFRQADELWLAIQCGPRISETMLDIMGVEDFDAVPNLESYAFERVFVLAYTGAYEWRRGAGWRRLTGKSHGGGDMA